MLQTTRRPINAPRSDVLDRLAAQGVSSRFVEVAGLATHYLAAGEGRPGTPILLLHGMMASGEYWVNNLAPLAEHHPVYAPTFWGHGWSAGEAGHPHTMHNFVTFVRRFMQEVGLKRVHLVGHSMGGHIAARFAIEHPTRVSKLVLCSPAGLRRDQRPNLQQLRDGFNPNNFNLNYRLMMLRLMTQALASQRQGHTLRMIYRDTLDADLHQIVAPTLLVWGRHDTLVPLAYSQRWLDGIPAARLSVLDSSHTMQFHNAAEFNRLVLDFCR